MPRDKIFDVQNSPFSTWHRRQNDGIMMTDLDVVGICPGCATPLFIADTIYNKDFRFRGKNSFLQFPYKFLSEKADIPYFEIFYTCDESKRHRPCIRFDIRRIRPFTKKFWKNLSEDQMLQFLEHMALVSHGPNCTRKDYLIRRITANKCGNNFIRQQKYVEFLSI